MLKNLIARLSDALLAARRNRTYNQMLANGTLKVGRGTYGVPDIQTYKGSEANITIGHFSSIGPDVTIITGGIHPIRSVSQFPFRSVFGLEGAYKDGNPSTRGEVHIGSDVWLCSGVSILSGVTIGDGAVVYNNALVNRNIPPYAIVAGLPGKVVGYRFDQETIDKLLRIKWWDWPQDKVLSNVRSLTSENVTEFINEHLTGTVGQ